MFGTLSAAYKIWTALEREPDSPSRQEHAAAETMLMTGEPQSIADIVLVLRTLAHRFPDDETADGVDRRRLLQMCDYLDANADVDTETGAADGLYSLP